MSVEDNLKLISNVLIEINTTLNKMANGCATIPTSAPQVENSRPQDKPESKPEKAADKKASAKTSATAPGNGKTATTDAAQTTSSQKTDTTAQSAGPKGKDDISNQGLATLRSLTAAYKDQGNPDPQEAARLQISAALVSSTSNQAERIKDILPVDYEAAFAALAGLKAESSEIDVEALI